ncbi:MAG TPA: hypothetical protein PKG52_07425 [bacterium]|nr:hypothetical protein [bacterium]HPS29248.1 hypothetical protein [bacterium]
MYSFIFITHGGLGSILTDIAQRIMDENISGRTKIFSIDFSMADVMDELKEKIKTSVDEFLVKKQKVIIFVDIFGGSPSNIAFSFAKTENVDVVSGVNLSMVMYAVEHMNSGKDFPAMIESITRTGAQNITSAKKLLMKRESL